MKLIFLHIPKAGGTTFHAVLERFYKKDEIFDIEVEGNGLTTQKFIGTTAEFKKQIRLLKGHMKFGLHQYFKPEPATYITFLRNPADRIISHYYYILRKPDHYLHSVVTSKKMSLLDFALSDISEELDNGQLRLISGAENIGINKCDTEMLNNAINNLKTSFSGFGITEKFNESLVVLKNKLNWTEVPYYMSLNVSGNKEEKVGSEIVEQIKKRNSLDMKLYNWCLEEFSRNISEIKDFDVQLRILENCNVSYVRGVEKGQTSGYNKGFRKGYDFGVNNTLIRRISNKLKKSFGSSPE